MIRDRGASQAPGPAVVPGRPSAPAAGRFDPSSPPGLIPITPGPVRDRRVSTTGPDPKAFWDEYFKTHDETAVDLLETVSHLGHARKFDHVEAAVLGFLKHHRGEAEPWMYQSLAVALDLNKRDAEMVKTTLGYAAVLADGSRNPDQLIMVADLLMVRGLIEPMEVRSGTNARTISAGALLDHAIRVAPHLPAAPMMSVNLARQAKDPIRMASALEHLLGLGWPDADPTIRLQARREAEALAKDLRLEDRSAEADTLLAALADAEGRDLYIRLTWSGDADLDLRVREPLGAVSSHRTRRTVFGGALIEEGVGRTRTEEVYSCPRGFDGDYTIEVETIYNDPEAPIDAATLEIITHEGRPDERKESRTVDVKRPEPVVVRLDGGRRKVVLPFVAPANARPVEADRPSTLNATSTPGPESPDRARDAADLLRPGGAGIPSGPRPSPEVPSRTPPPATRP